MNDCHRFTLRTSQVALLRTALIQLPTAELVRSGVLTLEDQDGIRTMLFAMEEFLRSRVAPGPDSSSYPYPPAG